MCTMGTSSGKECLNNISIIKTMTMFSHGTALRRAMDQRCVDIKRSTHIGIHGSMGSDDLLKEDQEKGWLTITMDEFVEKGPLGVAEIVKERIGDAPTVISFDVYVLEPGECPGIGFPEPGFYYNKL